MPDDPKSRRAPCRYKLIGMGPTVETDRKTVASQHAVHLSKGWLEPCVVVIVRYTPTVSAAIVRQIWWIGEHEIHAACRQPRQHVNAVAVDDGVARRHHRRAPLCRSELLARRVVF